MKRIVLMTAIALATLTSLTAAHAQDKQTEWVYTDASVFPLYGKASSEAGGTYARLPQRLENVSRPQIWKLGQNSAGLQLRFRSDSPSIKIRWTSLYKNSMNHMSDTGTRGVDLYILEKDGWHYAGSGRPSQKDQTTDAKVVADMDGSEHEFLLNLSLYDGISSLEIGVEKGRSLDQPSVEHPKRGRKIVMYGTSILQGGCVSRPGMTFTNILSRKLDMEVINLGFSGNALLDYEIAELMAAVENPAVFVFDYVPNPRAELIAEKGEKFFWTVRNAHPEVPVIFMEDPVFPHSRYDSRMRAEINAKNFQQKALYERLKKQGVKRIYYLGSEGEFGNDGEATVDGVHMTDLGSMRYVEHIMPVLKKALRCSR